jgi:hypothetical protein
VHEVVVADEVPAKEMASPTPPGMAARGVAVKPVVATIGPRSDARDPECVDQRIGER